MQTRAVFVRLLLFVCFSCLVLTLSSGPLAPSTAQAAPSFQTSIELCGKLPRGAEFGKLTADSRSGNCVAAYDFAFSGGHQEIQFLIAGEDDVDAAKKDLAQEKAWYPTYGSAPYGDEGIEGFEKIIEDNTDTGVGRFGLYFRRGTCVVGLETGLRSTELELVEQAKKTASAIDAGINQTCQPYQGTSPTETLKTPIIVLPGVAGTELHSDKGELWPFPTSGDWHREQLALGMDGKPPDSSVQTGPILQGGLADFYRSLLDSLRAKGYENGKTLFTLPYDWRLDNKGHAEELDAVIDEALRASHQPKAILIAHSMGGLIARYYILSRPDRAAKVDTLITIDTPYGGAPKAFYALVMGYTFGNPSIRQYSMKILAQNMPAAYQLAPRLPFVYDSDKLERTVSLADTFNTISYKGYVSGTRMGNTPILTPLELPEARELLGNQPPTYPAESEQNVWRLNPDLVSLADQFYSLGGTPTDPKPLPNGIKHYVIIGQGIRTLVGYYLRDYKKGWIWDERALRFKDRKQVLEPVFGNGDGTVPLWGEEIKKATASYFISNVTKLDVRESSGHGDMPANPTAQKIISSILDGNPLPTRDYSRNDPNIKIWQGGKVEYADLLDPGEGINFTLRSAAHLRLVDNATNTALGPNDQGGIDENLSTGTFLEMGPYEYASVGLVDMNVQTQITGTQDGTFSLYMEVVRSGLLDTFVYADVPVKDGTVAQMTLNPAQITGEVPDLQVTTDGQTTSVKALSQEPFLHPTGSGTVAAPTAPIPAGSVIAVLFCLMGFALVLILGVVGVGRKRRSKQGPRRPQPLPIQPLPTPSSAQARVPQAALLVTPVQQPAAWQPMTAGNRFTEAEARYFALRGRLAAGRMTREQFEAALKELLVRDPRGYYWTIGADTAKWYFHDGRQWVQGQPPGV